MEFTNTIKFRKSPSNAAWVDTFDFTYVSQDTGVVTVNSSGVITPKATGSTSITIKHKATDQSFSMDVVVYSKKTNKGTLSRWSDIEADVIGHWAESPTVYAENIDSANTAFYFGEGVDSAIDQWNDALGLSMTLTNSESNADIVVLGGTHQQLAARGHAVSDGANGSTTWSYSIVGYYAYNNTVKLEAVIISARIGIVSGSRTANEYRKTVTHEMGHALGYWGHSSGTTDVMYFAGHASYTLKSNDYAHLQQVYE